MSRVCYLTSWFWLQVICWVLGEYGTADGKYSASYITGKLCDVAESHSSDDTVKVYVTISLLLYGVIFATKFFFSNYFSPDIGFS